MAFCCIRCRSPIVKEKDRISQNVRVYQCQKCGYSWMKVMKYSRDLLRKPYSIFKRGLRETPKLRELGYKSK